MKIENFKGSSDSDISPEDMVRLNNLTIIIKSERIDRPNMGDFADTFTPEKIADDQRRLSRIKSRIKEENRRLPQKEKAQKLLQKSKGEALEVVVGQSIELRDWLGSRAMVQRTSEYDDIVNGVDAIVEFTPDFEDEEVQRIALAVDAYSGTSPRILEQKIRKNIDKINGNTDPMRIEYFESQIPDNNGNRYKGPLEEVIPVVIGVSGQNVEDLFEDFAKLVRLRKRGGEINKREKELKRSLEQKITIHPVQRLFLKEIQLQLKGYLNIPGLRSSTEEEVRDILEIIEQILEEKRDSIPHSKDVENDRILEMMKNVI
ncbi:MAG: hypothetical protein R3346_03110 [Candidatus Spechtbacterales bacterium]|nr:hypothetical protein [Candidatus Spechtbacterales bacterium]